MLSNLLLPCSFSDHQIIIAFGHWAGIIHSILYFFCHFYIQVSKCRKKTIFIRQSIFQFRNQFDHRTILNANHDQIVFGAWLFRIKYSSSPFSQRSRQLACNWCDQIHWRHTRRLIFNNMLTFLVFILFTQSIISNNYYKKYLFLQLIMFMHCHLSLLKFIDCVVQVFVSVAFFFYLISYDR